MQENQVTTIQKPISTTKNSFNFGKYIYFILVAFATVFTIGIFFGRIVFFPIKVEGLSMQPTLNAKAIGENDHCDTVYLGSVRNVQRGNIIVFSPNPDSNSSTYYIKRAIGLPGDTLYFAKNGTEKEGKIYYDIYVNGVKLEERYIKEPMWFNTLNHNFAEETFFNTYVETQQKIKLAENEYFLMGDNRNNSLDSRILGAIPKSSFLGKVYLQIKNGQTLIEALFQKIF